jgi:hypothetical protein
MSGESKERWEVEHVHLACQATDEPIILITLVSNGLSMTRILHLMAFKQMFAKNQNAIDSYGPKLL